MKEHTALKWILTILMVLLALAAAAFIAFYVFNFGGRTPTIGNKTVAVSTTESQTEDPTAEVSEVNLEDVTDANGNVVESSPVVDTGVSNQNGDVESVIIEYPNGAEELN